MSQPESHIRAAQRFKNFWSNVSNIEVAKTVPDTTQRAIVRGMEHAYGKEHEETGDSSG